MMDDEGKRQETERRQAIRAALCQFLRHRGLLRQEDGEDTAAVLRRALLFRREPGPGVLVNLEDLVAGDSAAERPGHLARTARTGSARPNTAWKSSM